MDIDISPFSLSDPMLVRRYVFSRRSVLNDRSAVAVDTAKVKVANIFRTVVMFGNTTRRLNTQKIGEILTSLIQPCFEFELE